MTQLISTVTICFNNLPEVIATCQSVDQQNIPPFEHLLIDGSTNREILTWLQTNPQPAYRRWIHERDYGISDAFNKGIRQTNGNIIHLLNSGDLYADKDALKIVGDCFENDPFLMWTNSKYIQHRGEMDVISGQPFEKDKLWKGMRMIAHPSMFVRKEVYIRNGLYGTDFKIAMDYDMLVRIRDEKNAFLDQTLVYFAPGGASDQQFQLGLMEVRKSYQKHIGKSMRQSLWQIRQKLLHRFMQTSVGKRWFQNKNKSNAR